MHAASQQQQVTTIILNLLVFGTSLAVAITGITGISVAIIVVIVALNWITVFYALSLTFRWRSVWASEVSNALSNDLSSIRSSALSPTSAMSNFSSRKPGSSSSRKLLVLESITLLALLCSWFVKRAYRICKLWSQVASDQWYQLSRKTTNIKNRLVLMAEKGVHTNKYQISCRLSNRNESWSFHDHLKSELTHNGWEHGPVEHDVP